MRGRHRARHGRGRSAARVARRALVALLPVVGLVAAANAGASPEPTPRVVPVEVAAARLGPGVNLGNTFEIPGGGGWRVDGADLDAVRTAGFRSVRLPVDFSEHAASRPPYAIDRAFLERVAATVAAATQRDLGVVVDVHGWQSLHDRPALERPRFLAVWDQLARRFRHEPSSVAFELLNEPRGRLTAVWNDVVADAVRVIRRTNPTRTIVVDGAPWASAAALESLRVPDDDHLVATFHLYEPFRFTHQGAQWVDGADAWRGTPWTGTPAQRVEVDRHLDLAERWSRRTGIPVYLGEFGAYHRAPMGDRVTWTRHVRRGAEARGMSWSYWELAAGFRVYKREVRAWEEPLLRALIPGSPALGLAPAVR